mmetsp:Transcript_12480/g.37494  ORF Transcript_12480/g.37494 Transcript_12480/m.37494 type:complete len:415 (-) Transcript_12480:107-1351(-)|eukprot:CAMPEP_0118857694 /NCGR_PEP_ID=MMETSP1163-20130328/4678_1 /TAXON_ID=124430 /ORGANISM="Phaeomonas parva, Strain CCMP2877" /LENGTH=414 /DNA_ID=CAMNT_0006791031 /DNA_START=259 /DNA_END=1503 /DNA_ORIENTATION=-
MPSRRAKPKAGAKPKADPKPKAKANAKPKAKANAKRKPKPKANPKPKAKAKPRGKAKGENASPNPKAAANREVVFEPGEVVYARDQERLYKAKVLRARNDAGVGRQYYIHFNGWNSKWDVWMPPVALMKDTPQTVKKAKELESIAKGDPPRGAKRERGAGAAGGGAADAGETSEEAERRLEQGRLKRQKLKERQLFEDSGVPQTKLPVPMDLKQLAVDDWEKITDQRLVVPLPRSPCVADVLRRYVEYKESQGVDVGEKNGIAHVATGLESYFNDAVGALLLYREEEPQWKAVRKLGRPPARVYGCEHLLRLLVKMPFLVRTAALLPRELTGFRREIAALFQFLQKEKDTVFLEEYVPLERAAEALEVANPSANPDPNADGGGAKLVGVSIEEEEGEEAGLKVEPKVEAEAAQA